MPRKRQEKDTAAEHMAELRALRARVAELETGQGAGLTAQEQARRDEQHLHRYLKTLLRINATLRSTLPLQQVLDTIVQGVGEALAYPSVLIAVPDETGARLRLGAAWGSEEITSALRLAAKDPALYSLPLTVQANPLVRAFLAGEPVAWTGSLAAIVAGIEPEIPVRLARDIRAHMGSKLAIYVPLTILLRTVGVLIVFSQNDSLSDQEQELLQGVAGQAGMAIETARRFEEAQTLRTFSESILQSMAEGIAVQDRAGRILFLNKAGLAMLGYSQQELIGCPWSTIVPPDQQPIVQAADARRARGESDHYRLVLVRRDGSRLPVTVSGSPRLDAAGRFVGTLALFSDASQQEQAEAAMARRAREMAALYETSLDINSLRGLADLLPAIVGRAADLLGLSMGGLYLMRDEDTLELVVSYNHPHDFRGVRMQLGEGLSGRAAAQGRPLMVADYAAWEGRAAAYEGVPFRRVLAVPLKTGDRVIGVIDVVDNKQTGDFGEDEVRLVSMFADQAAIALENARLYEEAQHRLKALTTLFDISAAVSVSLDTERVLQATAETMTAALGTEGCAISLYDAERDALVILKDFFVAPDESLDPPGTTYALADYPATRQALLTRQPMQVQIGDPEADPAEVALMASQAVLSLLMVPLVVRDKTIGLLEMIECTHERRFTATEISVCQTLANQLAASLDNARLFEAEHTSRERAEALRQAAQAMGSSLELDEILRLILEQLREVLIYDTASVLIYRQPHALELVVGIGYRDGVRTSREASHLLPESPILSRMASDLQPIVCDDVRTLEGWVWIPGAEHVRSWLAIPLVAHGQMIGTLMVDHAQPGFFQETDVQIAQALAQHAAQAVENARLFEETVRRNRELALLNRVIAASAASQDIEPILEMVCRELAQALDVPGAGAVLLNDNQTELTVVAEYPPSGPQQNLPAGAAGALGLTFPVDAPQAFRAILEQQAPLVITDAPASPCLAPLGYLFQERGVATVLELPLLVEGQLLGFIGLGAVQPRDFTTDDVGLAWRVANQAAGALARVRLAKAQQQLSIAVEQAAESVVITDPAGKILYVNPAFEHVTGYSRAEAIGRKPSILQSGKQDEAFYRGLWTTIMSDQVWEGQFVNKKKDGSLYTEKATISPVHNQAGEIVSYVAVKRDVTREVQLEEQFRQSQKMEAMGRLAGGIAHDFNNLLTVIQVSAWLMHRQIRPEDPLWEHVHRIQDTVERATNLVKQLLSFSRRQIIEPEILSLNQVVGDMSRMLQRIIGEDTHLITSLASDLWLVHVDPTQIEQVLMNLVINARDAMPGGGTVIIETANVVLDEGYTSLHIGAQPGEHVRLSIADTGVGMSDEAKAHLFEPFFTTKSQGQGTGLGLPTVFGIVNQNNGHIWVESESGRGTTVKIYLPRALDGTPVAPAQAAPIVTDGRAHQGETILVVEDETPVRELIERVLSGHGYRVLSAPDGATAMAISEKYAGPIHLLLTDVIMPHMNGKELATQLQQRRAELRVVYMSGYAADAIVHHGVLEPGTILVSKPFSMETLIHKVRGVLDS